MARRLGFLIDNLFVKLSSQVFYRDSHTNHYIFVGLGRLWFSAYLKTEASLIMRNTIGFVVVVEKIHIIKKTIKKIAVSFR